MSSSSRPCVRRRTRRRWAAVAGTLLLSCAGFQIRTDYDPEADFSRLRSWYWLPPAPGGDPRVKNDLVEARVRAAVERVLGDRGYIEAPSGEGDFGIGYHAAIEGRIDVRTVDHFYGYGRRWGPYGGVARETVVTQYDEGTLILDVVDSRTQRLVWRGSAQARVRDDLDPRERAERIQGAVEQMLAEFPPR